MATYKGFSAYQKALAGGKTSATHGSGAVCKSEAEARAKVAKWQTIVEAKLRQVMQSEGYRSGGTRFYNRTGAYPTHTQHSGITVGGGFAEGTVGYTPYVVSGWYGGGSVDITQIIEQGYQVSTPAWYVNIYGGFSYDFRQIRYFGYRPPVAVREMVVSALKGMAAADGVKLSLG